MADNDIDDFLYENFGSTTDAVQKVKNAKSDLHLREVIEYTYNLPILLEKFDFDDFKCSLIFLGVAGKYGGLKVFDVKFRIIDEHEYDGFSSYYQKKPNFIDSFYTLNAKLTDHLDIEFLGMLSSNPFNIESFEIEIPLSSRKEDYIEKIHTNLLNSNQLTKLSKIYLEYELPNKTSSKVAKKSKV